MDRKGKEPVDNNGKEAWGEIKGMRQGTHKGKRPGV